MRKTRIVIDISGVAIREVLWEGKPSATVRAATVKRHLNLQKKV